MNYYDFIPYLHEDSTVSPVANPFSVTEPGTFPLEPELEPTPVPTPGQGGSSGELPIEKIIEIVMKAIVFITQNSVLMVVFCSGLLGVGFRIIMQAKKTSKL